MFSACEWPVFFSNDGRRGEVLYERVFEELPVGLALQALLEGDLVRVGPHYLLQVLLHRVCGVLAKKVLGQHDALCTATNQADGGVQSVQVGMKLDHLQTEDVSWLEAGHLHEDRRCRWAARVTAGGTLGGQCGWALSAGSHQSIASV